ncbi:MAG: hypothetical protein N2253_02735 [Bacteroidia bacterium]|nr:hypothetical protein [Bacteroidia bacterium]MCX7763793.1 hypothetical protein [Bacteroidia bacterium]MDW8056922.1 hypothetical protein [Bacteroidia bacterium]
MPSVVLLYAVLGGLDFSQGEWSLVGVSLPNYAPHPLQQRFSAFIVQDKSILQAMQSLWEGQTFYEDYCDYHYVLKLYRGRRLIKTLKVNLRCGYITEGVFSYTFSPEWLERFAGSFRPIHWSRVWFRQNENLRNAVRALLEAPEVFFYEEPEPYLYGGRFIIALDSLHWRIDRDSLYRTVKAQIERAFPPGKAYVRPYFFFMDDKALLHFRFEVFCEKQDYEKYGKSLQVSVGWQPHIGPGEAKRLILIGINRERFFAYVNAWRQKHGATSELPE